MISWVHCQRIVMLTEGMLLFAKPSDPERTVIDYIFLVHLLSLERHAGHGELRRSFDLCKIQS